MFLVGTLTLTGSFIAFGKLQGLLSSTKPITFPGQQIFNAIASGNYIIAAYLIDSRPMV